ncbi:Oxidoreductase htatip2-like protein [Phytophthora palmivora]|uniref:Oxidoreductase htatip2-like protein n=1 Tax=Phytophthora palmivora TaxID=4796 RepID=A0A2P4X0G2_9STRA|nr:Oxidoreductase htatip2-like protein [Phytophthora palmivora]
MGYVALVQGGTGAVGRDLVAELVQSPSCTKVIALTRREIPESQWGDAFPSMDVSAAQNKLEIIPVDFEELHRDWKKVPVDVDAAFSCLGTTRKDAGSAEAFRKVDLEYVTKFAEIVKDAGVPYFGLLTASNANKNSWFLYPQTKGEVEENIKNLNFERTSIFRPGLIDRGELARTVESIAGYFLPSITTRGIAKGMVVDYETGEKGLKEWSNTDLKQYESAPVGSAKQTEL